jgi:hypothetical protein
LAGWDEVESSPYGNSSGVWQQAQTLLAENLEIVVSLPDLILPRGRSEVHSGVTLSENGRWMVGIRKR